MNIVILVTVKDRKEAQKIANGLVGQRLVACANIVPGVKSVFFWKGKADRAQEVLLILKSKRSFFKKVEKAVKALHSYEVPEVIALPIIEGSRDYLRWVNDTVG